MQAVSNINAIKPGMYQIESSTTQTRAPQLTQTSWNTNPRVSTSTGAAHKTNVSRPQPRSNQMKDKVMPNTSYVKFNKTEVEEHPRILFKEISRSTGFTMSKVSIIIFSRLGQFCDADLEVAFRKSTCFVRDLQGNDLLTDNRGTDLYTISLQEKTSSTPICLPTQAWLWHRRFSLLNFDYINLLSKKVLFQATPLLTRVGNYRKRLSVISAVRDVRFC
ncbi:hypothetical protein Tco_0530028 [Tanacetum coccineum]